MNDGVWIVLGLASLAVVIALIGSAIHEYRGKQLREAAEELGFTFSAEAPALAVELFGAGASSVRVQNVLRGQAQGLEVIVFDLLQLLRRGQHVRHVRFSLLLFRDEEANWPAFALRPRGFLSRLGNRSGPGANLFDDDRAFARCYQLESLRTSGQEMEVETTAGVFTEEVRRYFAEHPGLWVEGGQQKLILSQGKVLPAAGVRAFLESGFEVMNVLKTGDRKE